VQWKRKLGLVIAVKKFRFFLDGIEDYLRYLSDTNERDIESLSDVLEEDQVPDHVSGIETMVHGAEID